MPFSVRKVSKPSAAGITRGRIFVHMTAEHISMVIVGGGPIGLACAIEAGRAEIDYVVIEKGCLVNSLYHYPANMTFFSTSERLEIGGVPFVSNNPKPTRSEALEYYRRVAAAFRINLRLFEEVRQISTGKGTGAGRFLVSTSRGQISADQVIVATGFYDLPFALGVPGENLPKVRHYFGDPHFYSFQKVLVVGAMNSAVDAALETWRKGAEVTMVIRETEIGERVKYWVRPDIINRIQEGSIRAYYQSTIEAIRAESVDLATPDGIVTVPNDWVLAMTGYQPNLAFLQSAGVHLADDEARTPEFDAATHETNVPGLFLAGVICGGMNTHRLFIENSREHATRIIETISSRRGRDR